MTSRPLYYPLLGGLDQETPAISIPAGRVIAVSNHEAVSQGYQRTEGFERFDGQPAPSEAKFYLMTFDTGTQAIAAGDRLLGTTTGASCTVLADPVIDSGSFAGGDAAGTVAVWDLDGALTTGETLNVGGIAGIICDSPPTLGDANVSDTDRAYQTAVETVTRAAITAVPGQGPVRGVLWFDGKLHAWRDNVGETAAILHQSSSNGWSVPDLGSNMLFSAAGPYELADGDVITGQISGATATVRTVAVDALGYWDQSNATGTLVLDNVTGVFESDERLNVGVNESVATVASLPESAGFPAGGRYEFDIHNFYGTTGTDRAYGVNGVSKAFEFDGASIIPITTGMPEDKPFLLAAHKNHLFLGFPQGSLQHSDLGNPRSFTAILGAAELGMGHELTNIIPNASATLLITTERSLGVLTGNDSSDWLLEGLTDDEGAKAHSAQRIGQIIYLDERGVRSVAATSTYANFKMGTYTSLIQKELDAKRKSGAQPIASCVVKSKDQYLLFFDDGTGISIYFGRKKPEPMLFNYPFTVSCLEVAEVDGRERVFVGTTDGFVHELNVGTSFDGAVVEAFIQLPYGHQGGPRAMKRYHKAVAELIANPNTTLAMVAQFDYGTGLQPYSHSEVFGLEGEGGVWGISNWAEFQWDAPTIAQAESYLQGLGANMSLIVFSSSAEMESYTLQGMTVMFSVRGQKR